MIDRQSSFFPILHSDFVRYSVVETVFNSSFESNSDKTIIKQPAALKRGVELYILIKHTFNGFDLGTVRLVSPAVLYPCIQNFSTLATAMILQGILSMLLKPQRRVRILAIENVLVAYARI